MVGIKAQQMPWSTSQYQEVQKCYKKKKRKGRKKNVRVCTSQQKKERQIEGVTTSQIWNNLPQKEFRTVTNYKPLEKKITNFEFLAKAGREGGRQRW